MSNALLDQAVPHVLAYYDVFTLRPPCHALGNHGGFSGARLWRMEGVAGNWCIRAWPSADPSPERLDWIHRLQGLARAAGLSFIPTVCPTRSGATWVQVAGRLWEITTWMPGQADFSQRPSAKRLEAAFSGLAQLHNAWARMSSPEHGPCPAVRRRWERADQWLTLVRSGWRPAMSSDRGAPAVPWVERAWRALQGKIEEVPRRLAPWLTRPLPFQPCLCDIWHDHVLFEAGRLSGLVDFGGVKVDHVAADLARLLGSMVGDQADLRDLGLRAYRRWRPLSLEEEYLVPILDQTGTILAVANWLQWLYREGRTFEDRQAVAQRLGSLVERIERW